MSEVWVINPSVIKHGHEEPGSPLCSRETYWQSCRDAAELGGDGGTVIRGEGSLGQGSPRRAPLGQIACCKT